MQFFIALAIVALCTAGILRGLARSIFPARFKAKTGGACGCTGGCPALKTAPIPPQTPNPGPSERRPAA